MISSQRKDILKLRTSITVVAAVILSMFVYTPLTFAVTGPQGACGNSITVDNTPAGASAQCNMGITTTFNAGTLSFTNDANATTSPAVIGSNAFSFNTTVIDQRNINAGWRLEASSAGMQNTSNNVTTTIPLSFTGSSATCTPTFSGQNTCTTPVGYSIGTLSTSPQYFLSSGRNDTYISGTYQALTTGSYTFSGSEPAGTYTGIITISLVNAF